MQDPPRFSPPPTGRDRRDGRSASRLSARLVQERGNGFEPTHLLRQHGAGANAGSVMSVDGSLTAARGPGGSLWFTCSGTMSMAAACAASRLAASRAHCSATAAPTRGSQRGRRRTGRQRGGILVGIPRKARIQPRVQLGECRWRAPRHQGLHRMRAGVLVESHVLSQRGGQKREAPRGRGSCPGSIRTRGTGGRRCGGRTRPGARNGGPEWRRFSAQAGSSAPWA